MKSCLGVRRLVTCWCQARWRLLIGRRDKMRHFSVDLCCPVEALSRCPRVLACPHAARGCRFVFSFPVDSRCLVHLDGCHCKYCGNKNDYRHSVSGFRSGIYNFQSLGTGFRSGGISFPITGYRLRVGGVGGSISSCFKLCRDTTVSQLA